jgi:hypothetical protein
MAPRMPPPENPGSNPPRIAADTTADEIESKPEEPHAVGWRLRMTFAACELSHGLRICA